MKNEMTFPVDKFHLWLKFCLEEKDDVPGYEWLTKSEGPLCTHYSSCLVSKLILSPSQIYKEGTFQDIQPWWSKNEVQALMGNCDVLSCIYMEEFHQITEDHGQGNLGAVGSTGYGQRQPLVMSFLFSSLQS